MAGGLELSSLRLMIPFQRGFQQHKQVRMNDENKTRNSRLETPSSSQMIFDLAKNLIRINYLVFVQFLLQ